MSKHCELRSCPSFTGLSRTSRVGLRPTPRSFGGFMKPTAADIAIIIGKIEARDWLDPSEEPISWSCVPKPALGSGG